MAIVDLASDGVDRSWAAPKVGPREWGHAVRGASPSSHRRHPSGLTAVEALGIPAWERVVKTPRVFHSSGGRKPATQTRELRVNALPTILRVAEEQTKAPATGDYYPTATVDGEFLRLYHERREQRIHDEEAEHVFLARDETGIVEPHQVAASQCKIFRNLIVDHVTRFRRPVDSLVDLASSMPFVHANRNCDLADLADALIVDIERCEFPFKGTVKRPGFSSLRIASRVAFVVSDPERRVALKSEALENGMHVLRVDLQVGEMRHIRYDFDNLVFRRSKLARRMSAILAPEDGVIAQIVRTLRGKEEQAKSLTGIVDDLLRDMTGALPQVIPSMDEELPLAESAPKVGGDAESSLRQNCQRKGFAASGSTAFGPPALASGPMGLEAEAAFQAITAKPRRTLRTLVGLLDMLANAIAPILPSLAPLLDRVSLAFVHEFERLILECFTKQESLREKLAASEAARITLSDMVEQMRGKGTSADVGTRLRQIEEELLDQERIHCQVLRELRAEKHKAEEEAALAATLRASNRELEKCNAALKRQLKDAMCLDVVSEGLRDDDGKSTSADAPGSKKIASRAINTYKASDVSCLASTFGDLGHRGRTMGDHERKVANHLFIVHSGTQTETEHYFSDESEAPDVINYNTHFDVLRTAGRLYRFLYQYEWNDKALVFMRKNSLDSFDMLNVDMSLVELLEHRPQNGCLLGTRAFKTVGPTIKQRLVAVHTLQKRVEHEVQKAAWSQAQAVITFFRDCTYKTFKTWITEFLQAQDKNSVAKAARRWKALTNEAFKKQEPIPGVTIDDIWRAIQDLGDTCGMKRRIRILEATLQHLASKTDLHESSLEQIFRNCAKKGLRTDSAGAEWYEQELMAPGHLLRELAEIWEELASSARRWQLTTPSSAKEALHSTIQSFYSRKLNNSANEELAIVYLCSSVLDQSLMNPEVGLFALFCNLQSAATAYEIAPKMNPMRPGRIDIDATMLNNMPVDTIVVVADFLRELIGCLGRESYSVEEGEPLPLSAVLNAGRRSVMARSRCAARAFEELLFSFTNFEEEAKRGSCHEAFYVSQLVSAYIRFEDGAEGGFAVEQALGKIWKAIIADAECLNATSLELGLQQLAESCSLDKVARLLYQFRVVHVSEDLLASALLSACGKSRDTNINTLEVNFTMFTQLANAGLQDTGNGYVSNSGRCRRCEVLWAVVWAVRVEAKLEDALTDQLFNMFDSDEKGHLNFEEYMAFLKCAFPTMGIVAAEDLFLSVMDNSLGGLPSRSFCMVAPSKGLRVGVDTLGELLQLKSLQLYGRKYTTT